VSVLKPTHHTSRSSFDLKTLGIGLTGFCAFLTLYATQPLLPHLEEVFHTSKVAVSLTVSAATLAVALAAPWVGMFADNRGRKKVIVPALCLLGLTTLLTATATTLPVLIAWRFLQGLLTPAVFAVAVAYVNEEWPKDQVGYATSVYVTGTVVGGFFGRFLSGLIASAFGWRSVFLVLGLLIFLLTWGVASWLPLAKQFKKVSDYGAGLHNMADHLKNPDLQVIFAVGFVLLFSLIGTFTYITFYLAAPPFGLGPSALGSLFFVYLMGAVITPLVGRRVDRLDGKKTLGLALAASALGVGLTLIPNLPLIIFGIALCSSGVFVCQIITNQRVGVVAGKSRALAIGLYVAFYYAGGFAGSVVPGLIWDWGRWPACVALIMGLQLLTVGFILLTWKKKRLHLHDSHDGEALGVMD
jgi:predicted MFS family arabinose efflux permease